VTRAWAAALLLAVPAGALAAASPALAAAAVVAALGAAALLVLPRAWLPALALALAALVPVTWLPVPRALVTLSPAVAVLGAWCLRLAADAAPLRWRRPTPGTRAAGVAAAGLAAWLVASLLLTRFPGTAVAWTAGFAVLALLPAALAPFEPGAARPVAATWTALATVLGVYAAVEAWVLRDNPLLGWAYRSAPAPDGFDQVWSVYRATTTLGHPLVNATFFAVTLPLAVDRALRHRRPLDLAAVAAAGAGLLATGSRGALVAGAVAATVTCALAVRDADARRWAPAVLALVAAGVVVGGASLLARTASTEGQTSLTYRIEVLGDALAVAGDHAVFGVGPGAAGVVKGEAERGVAAFPYENAWVEMVVATGVPGALLLAALCALAARRAAREGRAGVAGAIIAYAVTAATFNLLEGHRPAHVLLGALLVAAAGPARAAAPTGVGPRLRAAPA